MNTGVLLVEDDRMLQKLHAQILRKSFGCKVDIADDGSTALEMLVDNKYDLVLTDYFMPFLNGKELITILRMTGNKQRVLAITAATVGEEQTELLAAGADGVLSKPLDIDELASKLLQTNHQDQTKDKQSTGN